jgi:hypothetical protein
MLISTLGHVHTFVASDPLVAPTWATAIATIILAAGAIITAALAFLAFRKQTAELVVLQDQAKADREDRRHEATERRRERATMVYLTVAFDKGLRDNPEVIMLPREPSITVTVHNSGKQPVYDVRVHWVEATSGVQAGAEDKLGTIPPLNKDDAGRTLPAGTTESPLIPVAHFRDAAGVTWTMLDNGELDEVDPTHPAGAPIIATSAVASSNKRAGKAALLVAAMTAAADDNLTEAQRMLTLLKHVSDE